MTVNVFIMGLDEANLETLRDAPRLEKCRFHPLLSVEELWSDGEAIPLDDLLDRARAQLDAFDGEIDAIVGYWDFPVSSLVPILCAERGLRAAPLQAVVACEHKYWSRLLQREAIEEVPGFAAIDLDTDPEPQGLPEGVSYPVWVKPIKSASSELAFRVTDDAGFRDAIAQIREGVDFFAAPFDKVLARVEPPREVAEMGGRACLIEEEAHGAQATVEGYVHDGEPYVYGIVDSVSYRDTSSFQRYQYPSTLPSGVQDRLADVSKRVIRHIGLDSVTFNIEYFVDTDTGDVRLLEINPRHSQSHAHLFEYVDGEPNHTAVIELALGRAPEMPHRKGRFAVAAKWFVRSFVEDGVVRRAPTEEEVARAEATADGVSVHINVSEGDRLSQMRGEDSYSYELAHIYLGAADQRELESKYAECVHALPFAIDTDV